MRKCCNKVHGDQPAQATHVLVDRQNHPHYLCEPCADLLDHIGNLDTFIQDIDAYDQEQMTPEERRREDWLDYGDQLYERSVEERL